MKNLKIIAAIAVALFSANVFAANGGYGTKSTVSCKSGTNLQYVENEVNLFSDTYDITNPSVSTVVVNGVITYTVCATKTLL